MIHRVCDRDLALVIISHRLIEGGLEKGQSSGGDGVHEVIMRVLRVTLVPLEEAGSIEGGVSGRRCDLEQLWVVESHGSNHALVTQANGIADCAAVLFDVERLFGCSADVEVHVAVVGLQSVEQGGVSGHTSGPTVLVGKVGLPQQEVEHLSDVGAPVVKMDSGLWQAYPVLDARD